MAEPVVKIGTLTDFLKLRTKYERAAVARMSERVNAGMTDATWDERVRDEIEIELLQNQDAIFNRIRLLEEAIFGEAELKAK